MVPTIEPAVAQERSVEEFYDALAPDYDSMTAFEKRFVQEGPFFRLLVDRYRIKSALDAGCGTGFHSIVLARSGVEVTAVDLSAEMLRQLGRHAVEMGIAIKALQAQFVDLPEALPARFDAVFCMGNTLAHMRSERELQAALTAFAGVLKPGGVFFAQTLNYDRILATREHIQNIKHAPDATYVRSYEYLDEAVRFTILRCPETGTGDETRQSIILRPVQRTGLEKLVREAGLFEPCFYGSIAMEPFDPGASRDMVVMARTPV